MSGHVLVVENGKRTLVHLFLDDECHQGLIECEREHPIYDDAQERVANGDLSVLPVLADAEEDGWREHGEDHVPINQTLYRHNPRCMFADCAELVDEVPDIDGVYEVRFNGDETGDDTECWVGDDSPADKDIEKALGA